MSSLWRAGKAVDAAVVVDGVRFEAHTIVLMSMSGYFEMCFSSGMMEQQSASVELREMSATVFGAALEFFYFGRCTVDDTDLEELLLVAARLQAPALQDVAAAAVVERLSTTSCCRVWQLGTALNLPEIGKAASKLARNQFASFAHSQGFLSLTEEQLLSLILDDSLHVEEASVFEALVRWAKAQAPPPSEDSMAQLVAAVRFPLLPRDFIEQRVRTEALMQSARHREIVSRAFQDKVYGVNGAAHAPRCCPHAMKRAGFSALEIKQIMGASSEKAKELYALCREFKATQHGSVIGEQGTAVVTFDGQFSVMQSSHKDHTGPWVLPGVHFDREQLRSQVLSQALLSCSAARDQEIRLFNEWLRDDGPGGHLQGFFETGAGTYTGALMPSELLRYSVRPLRWC